MGILTGTDRGLQGSTHPAGVATGVDQFLADDAEAEWTERCDECWDPLQRI